jgi:hypothetical protein
MLHLGGGNLRRVTLGMIGACAAGLVLAAVASPAHARDCTPRAQQEMDAINARAAAASKANDTPTLCREMAAQIRSYEFLISLFKDPSCAASDPRAGIDQLNTKVEPLRTAYDKYCR